MKNTQLKWIILLLSNSIVYSKLYYLFEENLGIGILWNLSHYVIYLIVCIKIGTLLEGFKNNIKRILALISLYLGLFGVIICAFICSSDLPIRVKNYTFGLELILTIYCMFILYKLNVNKMVSEKTTYSDNYEKSSVYKYIFSDINSQEKKSKVRAAFWVLICSFIILVLYFVSPMILKMVRAETYIVIMTYIISIIVLLISLYIKNSLYYQEKYKKWYVTIFEYFSILVASVFEYYWNVYLWLEYTDRHSVYFLCYVLLGVGIIPFLIISQKITKNYTEILSK